jgi:hypothetical protein
MLTVSVICSTMLATCTGVSASEFNASIVSLLQMVVEGKFVMGPVGIEEVTPDVDEGKFVIGPVSTEGVGANVVEGNLVIGPEGTDELTPVVDEGKFVIGPVGTEEEAPNVEDGKFVIGPVGTEEEAPDVEDGKFVIGPAGIEGVMTIVEDGEVTIACVSGAGENQAISATTAKMTDGRRWISRCFDRRLLNFTAQILRRNKVEIHFQRAEHDSGLMHERIVGSKRNVFNAV